ncbi:MAG: FAD-binding protein [Deltaproteobacteria bacterium]|nr:FAD-binding protein [Deltaproteobacteria bacterium]
MAGKVLILGAGLAGIAAAHAAAAAGAEVEIASRRVGLGSNSAMANTMFTAPLGGYPLDAYVADTIAIGKDLNLPWMVRLVGREAPASLEALAPLGLNLRAHGPTLILDSLRQDQIKGQLMMSALAKAIRRQPGVTVREGFHAREIVLAEGRAVGAAGWDHTGAWQVLRADAVILALGGAGAVYARNDNVRSILGQGYLLAARAGLPLHDLEFVQFYPLILDEPGLPSLLMYPNYPPQARVLGPDGEDVLAAIGVSDLNEGILKHRDSLSASLYEVCRRGKVTLDYTGVPDELWETYPLAALARLKFDFRQKPVGVSPGAHFCMGGVAVDQAYATARPGLFAAGEVVWGLHGANRRGGNAMTECVVSGRLAGEAAASLAGSAGPAPAASPAAPELAPAGAGSQPDGRELLARLRTIAWDRAGVVRDAAGLIAGLAEINALEAEVLTWRAAGVGPLRQRDDLLAGALAVKGILTASRARTESRGSFLRSDHPDPAPAPPQNSALVWQPADRSFRVSLAPAPTEP